MADWTTRPTSSDFKGVDMKKITIILSIVAFCAGCQKAVEYDSPLSLSAERNELSVAEGSTPVIVYADGAWTASLADGCDWARIDRSKGDGLGQIIFSYDENTSIVRKTVLTVTSGAHVKKIDMIQKSPSGAVLSFSHDKWEVARCSGRAHLPFSSLLPESETGNIRAAVSEGCDWITGVSVFANEISFDIARNDSNSVRTAVITAAFTDALGKVTEVSATISQSMENGKVIFSRSEGISAEEAELTIPFDTNMGLFLPQLLQSAESNSSWCRTGYSDSQELTLSVDANTTQASRQARITMSYTDNEGNTDNFYYIVLQKK